MKRGFLIVALVCLWALSAYAFVAGKVKTVPTYHALGDSITFGTGATDTSVDYVSLLGNFEHQAIVNRGAPGAVGCDMADQEIFNNENPNTINNNNPTYTEFTGGADANEKGVGPYEAVYTLCMQASLSWLGVPSTSKTFATQCSKTGTWSADTAYVQNIGLQSSTSGSTLTCNITTPSGILYGWYRFCDSCTGTFTYAIDGGSATSVSTTSTTPIAANGTHGEGLIRVTGLSAGSHSVVFTTTNSALVSIVGVGTPPPSNIKACCVVFDGGVYKFYADGESAQTAAYNTDAQNVQILLAGDGLNIVFVPVRNYVDDINGMLVANVHPNNLGHSQIAQAFETYWFPAQ
jgi:hypothetical protein